MLLRDITEQRRAAAERDALAARVQEQQQRESLSVLAGGLAHDFNNLLAGIVGNADLLSLKLAPSSEMGSNVGAILLGAQRAADLVDKMLAYAGERHGSTSRVDLDDLVRDLLDLLRASAARHCTLHYEGTPAFIDARLHADPPGGDEPDHQRGRSGRRGRRASSAIRIGIETPVGAAARGDGVGARCARRAPTRISRCATTVTAWTRRRCSGSSTRSSRRSQRARPRPRRGAGHHARPPRRAARRQHARLRGAVLRWFPLADLVGGVGMRNQRLRAEQDARRSPGRAARGPA